jgi:hypothetical protein
VGDMDSITPDFVDGISDFLVEAKPKKISGNSKMYSLELQEKYKKAKRKKTQLSKQARRKNRK